MFGRTLRAVRMTKPRGKPRTGGGALTRTLTASMAAAVRQSLSASASVGAYVETAAIAGSLSTSFTLTSSTTGSKPFTIGHAFKQGDVASGGVSVSGATAQVSEKNYWPDGSVKFAIISGAYTQSVAGSPVAVSLANGTASSGTALNTGNLKATGIAASIDAGAFGSASWPASSALWDSPFQTWVQGHLMSCWVYRQQIGSDAHLVAWLEVRYYSTGAVEVLPWVENCNVTPAATTKTATYSFTLGGTTRYSGSLSLQHHTRTPLISGTAVSHWLTTDPGVVPLHDRYYLQATGIVPPYLTETSATATQVTSLPTSFTPLMQGSHPAGIGSGGYSPSIGLLPEWDVLHLTCGNATTYKGVVFNAYNVGRYSIHYRDESDSYRPIRLSQHPTTLLPEPNSVAPLYAISHQPAFSYFAYLITGWRFLCEQVQMQAGANALFEQVANRENGSGIVKSQTAGSIRHAAWGIRTLSHALVVTPDSDTTMQTEYRDQVTNNVVYYHTRYVAQPANTFGWVQPYQGVGGYGDTSAYFDGPWMQDFFTATLGYMKDMALGLTTANATKLDALFSWKAQSIVGRFGGTGATEWLYRDATPYALAIAPAAVDWDTYNASEWYSTWRAAYNATYTATGTATYDSSAAPYITPGAIAEGDIRVRPFGILGAAAEAQPALAYAVKHGASGAEAAWQRLVTTSGWAAWLAEMDAQPVWSVAPSARPKWARGLAVNQWVEVAGSSIALAAPTNTATKPTPPQASGSAATRLDVWTGLSIDTRTTKVYSTANGGHGDYYGNEVCRIDMMADAPAWAEVLAGSSGVVINDSSTIADTGDRRYAQYMDGKPASRHSYSGQQFIERHNRALTMGGSTSPNGSFFENVESYQVGVGWDAYNAATQAPLYSYALGGTNNGWTPASAWSVAKDPTTECLYVVNATDVRKFTPATYGSSGGTWSSWASAPFSPYPGSYAAMAVDTTRSRLVWMLGSGGGIEIVHWDLSTGTPTTTTFPASAAATAMKASTALTGGPVAPLSAGCVFVPAIDAFLVRMGAAGSTVYKIDASTFAVSTLSTTGGSSVPAAAPFSDQQGIFTRWLYAPQLRGVLYFPNGASNAWFLRTH